MQEKASLKFSKKLKTNCHGCSNLFGGFCLKQKKIEEKGQHFFIDGFCYQKETASNLINPLIQRTLALGIVCTENIEDLKNTLGQIKKIDASIIPHVYCPGYSAGIVDAFLKYTMKTMGKNKWHFNSWEEHEPRLLDPLHYDVIFGNYTQNTFISCINAGKDISPVIKSYELMIKTVLDERKGHLAAFYGHQEDRQFVTYAPVFKFMQMNQDMLFIEKIKTFENWENYIAK